jgi:Orsellinic acid/F9775 biosynthesis cluster protein D
LGTSIRPTPAEDLSCFYPECSFVHLSLDRLQGHIQKEHNNSKTVLLKVLFFSSIQDSSESESTGLNDTANLASGEESSSDVAGPSSLGPIRGRVPHLQIRTTPYKRTGDSSSQSSSPSRRTFGTLSPLPIPLALPHLTAQSIPSPLNQVAYSCPNSPTPPHSDNEMDVDDSADLHLAELNEEEVLAKASFAIIPLPHLKTTPPTRLLICTKCRHGVLSSSLLSHSNTHNIKLLPEEKRNIQKIMDNSCFLDDSKEVTSPTAPCPPIDGISVQDGVACTQCSYCCVAPRTMQNHFYSLHKDAKGTAKEHSKPAQVQALFARRPKYFAVMPSLRGLDEDDLFTVYLRQCAPELDSLRILNPPLNSNEVPPLLKVTQWHEHLKDYTTDRDTVRKLLELLKLPTSKQGESCLGSPLRNTIESYMKKIRVQANNASLGIKCLLKECPRFVISFMLGFDINSIQLQDQHKMENTGFLSKKSLLRSTVSFSISGLTPSYFLLLATSLDTSSL